MQLSRALRVQSAQVIALVGGGGKTTAMFRLASELLAQGKRVITTTTTRLGADQVEAAGRAFLRYDNSRDFLDRVRGALASQASILIVGEDVEGGKVAGVPPEFVDELTVLGLADVIIYEADGAHKMPFKAPAGHEPVIASATTLLVPTIGAVAFGSPLDSAHVHRTEFVARLAGAQIGEPVTPMMAARVLAHPEGGLKHKPSAARAIVLVNQVESEQQFEDARALARLALGYGGIEAVALGALRDAHSPIRETHRRVAAIILAAGAGTRMQGRVKQLLPWRGKTLIENAIGFAMATNVNETIVVLGAHVDEIRPVVATTGARSVINPSWETGHASSIRAGLNALSPEIAAAVFINADQPRLNADVVDALIQRYRETDAPIIASVFAGKRGSPVLFDRGHFGELANLQGEQGGRELLAKYPVERVAFDDARMGIDLDTFEEYTRVVEQGGV